MKKILLILILGIFLVGTVSALSIDNWVYDQAMIEAEKQRKKDNVRNRPNRRLDRLYRINRNMNI